MKKQKVFLVTIHNENGTKKTNPLLPNEFHLAKTMLNEPGTTKIEIEIKQLTGANQTEIDNQLVLMF